MKKNSRSERKLTFLGIINLLKLIWCADKKLTILLFINNIIRKLIIPLKALIIKEILDIINVGLINNNDNQIYQSFIIMSVLFFMIFLINRIWWPINSYVQNISLAKLSNEIKMKIIDCVSDFKLEFFDVKENFDILSLAKQQVDGRRAIGIINNIINLIATFITLLVTCIPLIIYNWMLFLILLISSVPLLLLEKKFKNIVYNYNKKIISKTRYIDYIFSLYQNKQILKEIRYLNLNKFFKNEYEKEYEFIVKKSLRLQFLKLVLDIPFWLIQNIIIVISYYYFVKDASLSILTIGQAGYFISVAASLTNGIYSLGSSYNNTIESGLYGKNLIRLLKCDEKESINELSPLINKGDIIEFKNVSFSYADGTSALKNINLKIEIGKIYSLIGLNGAGKSTLIKLILRLYNPTEGIITLNGIDIKEFNIKKWWNLFSIYFQDYMNYDFTAAESIALEEKFNEDRIIKALTKMNFKDEILSLKNGLNTYLSKKYDNDGIELSIGQKSKIALARALYKERPIIILDEPSASLDPIAEFELFQNMKEIINDNTGIFITHRLSSAKIADEIIVLENGEIIECGSHEKLISSKGQYYSLFILKAKEYGVNNEE